MTAPAPEGWVVGGDSGEPVRAAEAFADTPRARLAAEGPSFSGAQSYAETARGALAATSESPAAEPVVFAETPRGQMVAEREADVEPVTFSTGDGEYTTANPGEINRLRLSRDYVEVGPTAVEAAPPVDYQFHPGQHNVSEVLDYLAAFPGDAERVLAEEREGKARSTILGDADS